MFALHVNVPSSVSTLEARLDLVLPAPAQGFSSGASATAQLDVVSWNQLVLYQPGKTSDDISITASLRIPADWHYGTALPVDNEGQGQINFRTVSLTMLVDSPVLTGRHFRHIPRRALFSIISKSPPTAKPPCNGCPRL
jgi:predicted metalloprotease with PDZ domain